VRERPVAEDDPNKGTHAIGNLWWGTTRRCSQRFVQRRNGQ